MAWTRQKSQMHEEHSAQDVERKCTEFHEKLMAAIDQKGADVSGPFVSSPLMIRAINGLHDLYMISPASPVNRPAIKY